LFFFLFTKYNIHAHIRYIDVESAVTTEEPNADASETATAVLADGTTIVLPPGTTATIVADDATTGADETVEPATTEDAATGEAVTGDNEVTATVVDDTLETSTIIIVDNGTDVFTTIKPENGHATDEEDASNDTVTIIAETTISDNATTIADNETTTDDSKITTEVIEVTGKDTLWTTTISIDYIILI
jgi:hypothetical protein